MTRIIAHYLPQFRENPGNNKRGRQAPVGWSAVKEARPLFEGQAQPRWPLGGNYYPPDDIEILRWQASLALEHGIYGFCFWQDWFGGKLLWEKPTELLRGDRELKLPFCVAWANRSWLKTERRQGRSALAEPQRQRDWQNHFLSVVPFFEDSRYVKIHRKPLFLILNSNSIPECGKFLEFWNELAVQRGFPGIYFVQLLSGRPVGRRPLPFNARLYLEPEYTIRHTLQRQWPGRSVVAANRSAADRAAAPFPAQATLADYDEIYQSILQRAPRQGEREILGVFTDWDDSPRQGQAPLVCSGSTPAKFEEYLLRQIERSLSLFDSDILFVQAWNDWLDGAYLEPDERYGTGYLEAVRGAKKRESGLNLPLYYRTIF